MLKYLNFYIRYHFNLFSNNSKAPFKVSTSETLYYIKNILPFLFSCRIGLTNSLLLNFQIS